MDTKIIERAGARRRRRTHSPEFRADAVAACQQPGVSVAAVALSRGLNANLLRRWLNEAEGRSAVRRVGARPSEPTFVPVKVNRPPPSSSEPPIRIEVRKGSTQIVVEWPMTNPAACVGWLRDLLG